MTDDAGFDALTRQIARDAGLALDAYKGKCLRRRIAVRMRACGVHSYAEYAALLARTPAEYDRLRDAITINVTRFFRNAETWERLRAEFLPGLWDRAGAGLRIWSAGCASGEEAYGLAMLAAEAAAARGRPDALDRVHVEATDVDRESLVRAEAARYRAEALAETPPELVARWFELDGAYYRVAEAIRRRVRVRHLDLGRDPPPGVFHLIVCRNVVIYFERPTQERLFAAFVDALVPGGILVLGKVETLFGPARDRLQLVDPRERIYRRPA
ncbi:MAG TPA: protein-glutamate O-methyltransferase CheR [Gemmatimonadales bacterium]|nr:protein-glutamate O-methyltransferase CheR [Gemmatimonadales bacterium]